MMLQQQREVDAEYLLFQAKREKAFLTGSEAVAEAVKRANVGMSVGYPITPQSEAMQLIGELYQMGYLQDYYRAENEFAVMASIHGASLGGGRVFTSTSGPGTLRAMEMFPVWAGARQPIVCAFVCRGLSLPPSIQPENIEMGMLLSTGMIMLHAETVQDYFDMILGAYAIAEQPEVHLPIGVFGDGFFLTHTREAVTLPPSDIKLKAYSPFAAPVPCFNSETPPLRITRDPLLNKSNAISYGANASWHQEILSASIRSKKHINRYLGGSLEIENPDAGIMIVASGTAVSQSREALRILHKMGIRAGLVKIKTIRPFPGEELAAATASASLILVPEFNAEGWLAREVMAALDRNSRVVSGPRVFGGMTMPPNLIVNEILSRIS